MHCKRCRVASGSSSKATRRGKVKMRLSPTVHHKKRKWICPRCGRARMETVHAKGGPDRRGSRGRVRSQDDPT